MEENRQLLRLVKPEAWAVNPGAERDQQAVAKILGNFFKREDEVATPKRYDWFRRNVYVDTENENKISVGTPITFIQQGHPMEKSNGLVDIFYHHERRTYPYNDEEEKQHRRKMEWRRLVADAEFMEFCEKYNFKFIPLIEWTVALHGFRLEPWRDYKLYYLTEKMTKICTKLFRTMHFMFSQFSMYRRIYNSSFNAIIALGIANANLERKLEEKKE